MGSRAFIELAVSIALAAPVLAHAQGARAQVAPSVQRQVAAPKPRARRVPTRAIRPRAPTAPRASLQQPTVRAPAGSSADAPSFSNLGPGAVEIGRRFNPTLEISSKVPLDRVYLSFAGKQYEYDVAPYSADRTAHRIVSTRSGRALPLRIPALRAGRHTLKATAVRKKGSTGRTRATPLSVEVEVQAPGAIDCKRDRALCTCASSHDASSMTLPYRVQYDAVSPRHDAVYAITGVAGKDWWLTRWDPASHCETARLKLNGLSGAHTWVSAALTVHPRSGKLLMAVDQWNKEMPFAGAYREYEALFVVLDPRTLAVERAVPFGGVAGERGEEMIKPAHIEVSQSGEKAFVLGTSSSRSGAHHGTLSVAFVDGPDNIASGFIGDWAERAGKETAVSWKYGARPLVRLPKTDMLLVPSHDNSGDAVMIDGARFGFSGLFGAANPHLLGFVGSTLYVLQGHTLASVQRSNLGAPQPFFAAPWDDGAARGGVVDASTSSIVVGGASKVCVYDLKGKQASCHDQPQRVGRILRGNVSRQVLVRLDEGTYGKPQRSRYVKLSF